MKTEETKKEVERKLEKLRNFAFILYPDSAKENWQQVLANLGQPVFWILHDKDFEVDKGTGEIKEKKPHYHVMIMFENQRLVTAVTKVAKFCGSNECIKKIKSKKAYARYLCHLDHPNKHRYNPEEVRSLNGADYNRTACTANEIEQRFDDKLAEIINFCKENKVFVYCYLIDYCISERRDWLKILHKAGSGQLVREYIKSFRWAHYKKMEESRLLDFRRYKKELAKHEKF